MCISLSIHIYIHILYIYMCIYIYIYLFVSLLLGKYGMIFLTLGCGFLELTSWTEREDW